MMTYKEAALLGSAIGCLMYGAFVYGAEKGRKDATDLLVSPQLVFRPEPYDCLATVHDGVCYCGQSVQAMQGSE